MENNQKSLTRKEMNAAYKTAEKIHKSDSGFKRAANIEFFLYVVAVLIAAFAIRLFIFEPVTVSGDSMKNTLFNDQRMFVEKVSYCFTAPRRGEIIICYYPDQTHADSPRSKTCVKRVIGLPGEELAVIGGHTYINGEPLDEDAYWNDVMSYDYGPITIPEDCVFVMGDNRNHSGDSRQSAVGPIPYYRIVGRARSVIWPLSAYKKL